MTQSLAASSGLPHSLRSADFERVVFGDFVLLPTARILYRRGVALQLGSRKLDILSVLVASAGQVVSHRELISKAWRGLVVEHGNLRVQITGLRKALGDGEAGARYIANIPGQGYSFVAPIERFAPGKREPARIPPELQELLDIISFAIGVRLEGELTLAALMERLSRARPLELRQGEHIPGTGSPQLELDVLAIAHTLHSLNGAFIRKSTVDGRV
jgi:DNA-binding winged helix-turn-helix (wHTH) protein